VDSTLLDSLDYPTFEVLVGLLLDRESFKVTKSPTEGGLRAVDFVATAPDGAITFVEARHVRRTRQRILRREYAEQVIRESDRLRKQYPTARTMLVTSGNLTPPVVDRLSAAAIQVWDGDHIRRLLESHPDVVDAVTAVQSAADRANDQRESLLRELVAPSKDPQNRAERAAAELRAISPGKDQWRAYERMGARMLTDIFFPDLGAPYEQSRSDDNLDILDAVFPIRASQPPWSTVRSEYKSRFVVGEFKNYAGPIGKKEVIQICQYLWDGAFRTFGLLVSRQQPSESARDTRLRAWREHKKLVVFLTDEDLVEMTRLADEQQDPFEIIDGQLEEFFLGLTP